MDKQKSSTISLVTNEVINYWMEEESVITAFLPEHETKTANRTTFKDACKKVSPMLMIMGAGLVFSVQALLSKLIPIPSGQYVITEAGFNVPFCLLICAHSGVNVSPFNIKENRLWFWGRVVFGGVAGGLKIVVIRNMNIGDATAILFSAPIWSGCLARIILKEKYTIVNLFATIVGLVGVVLVTKPGILFPDILDRGESSVPWACATLGVSLLFSVSYVCVRGAGEVVHPMKFVLYTAIAELPTGFLINLMMKESLVLPPCDYVRTLLFLCGLGAPLANVLIVRGLSLENSGPATLMRNWDTIYAYTFQVFFFKSAPDWISLLGAGLIVSTALLQGINKLFDISCGVTF